MAIKKVPIGTFVKYLEWCLENKCGYIMGSYGQDPKKWPKDSWWFTQYSGEQKKKALYWREHAPLVHDCNGLAEGGYQKETGVNINARARNNYATWCKPKGTGRIPASRRVPGAAVFMDGSYIHHVGYLWKPVTPNKPEGDWWVIEDRGVMYGCVKTKLYSRNWNKYGWMSKYFDYSAVDAEPEEEVEFGHRPLLYGTVGDDVKQLQVALITLGYSCGKWGADGEFGDATKNALKAFQKDVDLPINGIADEDVFVAINKLLPEDGEEQPEPVKEPVVKMVEIVGGNAWVRTQPNTTSSKLGVAEIGDKLQYRGETSVDGWISVKLDEEEGWVSGKYAKLVP